MCSCPIAGQFECVKSKWGLALAATVQIVVSLLISLALSSLLHMTPRLDGGEVFPYLVIFIGLENLVVLTRAVTSSQAQKQYDDVRERVAHALRAESWTISKHLVYELVIVMFGFITYVPTVQEFCQLALVGILIDFFMQINFWLAVLSIDIRRFTVGVRQKKNRSLDEGKKEIKVSLPMRMPHVNNRRQAQQQSQWARYRVLQRGSMLLLLIWVLLIFYKSCLIVDLLRNNGKIVSTDVLEGNRIGMF
jgi:predicted RND superfamily exporter protein